MYPVSLPLSLPCLYLMEGVGNQPAKISFLLFCKPGVGALALEAVVSGASSDGTLSEGGSSVVLDPGVRRVGLPQDYQDPDTLRDSPVTATTDTHTGELQPMASSASVASLVIAVETGLSDEEGSTEQSQLGDKS